MDLDAIEKRLGRSKDAVDWLVDNFEDLKAIVAERRSGGKPTVVLDGDVRLRALDAGGANLTIAGDVELSSGQGADSGVQASAAETGSS